MKKGKLMSSHGSLTTIVYGGSFEGRKVFIDSLLSQRFSGVSLEKIAVDLLDKDYKVADLRKTLSQTNFSSLRKGERVFIFFNSHKLTPLMQNMLLKTLEEPYLHSHYILEIASYHSLLSTIQSRSLLVSAYGEVDQEALSQKEYPSIDSLVHSSIVDSFKYCEKYSQDRDVAAAFLMHLTTHIRGLLINRATLPPERQQRLVAFADFLLQCHEWVLHTNVSSKTILENAMLGYRHCLAPFTIKN